MRRFSEAALRTAVRRQRENEAKRLHDVVPELESLTIAVEERRAEETQTEVAHLRRIVVDHAPAVFNLPCCDRHCDGEHDLTRRILRGLRDGKDRIEGHDRCEGHNKEGDCPLELRFIANATYHA